MTEGVRNDIVVKKEAKASSSAMQTQTVARPYQVAGSG